MPRAWVRASGVGGVPRTLRLSMMSHSFLRRLTEYSTVQRASNDCLALKVRVHSYFVRDTHPVRGSRERASPGELTSLTPTNSKPYPSHSLKRIRALANSAGRACQFTFESSGIHASDDRLLCMQHAPSDAETS